MWCAEAPVSGQEGTDKRWVRVDVVGQPLYQLVQCSTFDQWNA